MMGKGGIFIKLNNRDHQYIFDLFCVWEMKCNLLSLEQLLEKGYDMHMLKNEITIFYDWGKLILKSPLTKNDMFKINIKNVIYHCFNSILKDEFWLWHLWYGHLNFCNLKELAQKNMVKGSINCLGQICEGCIFEKQHKNSFMSRKNWHASKAFEFFRCVWPLNVTSHGNYYFLTFIDDFTRKFVYIF